MRNLSNLAAVVLVSIVAACSSPSSSSPASDSGPGGGGGSDAGSGSGSSSGSDTMEQNRSGTRIKMQVLTTPDGAKQFQGWFDTQRNEPCSFAQSADGVTRCIPAVAASTLFADANCSTPAALLLAPSTGCTSYITTSQSLSTTCPQMVHDGPIFPATVVSPMPKVFTKSGSLCVESTVSSAFVIAVVSGPEIPPSSFQSATLAVE